MLKLEELQPNEVVRRARKERAVMVVGARWFDSNAIKFGVTGQALPNTLRRLTGLGDYLNDYI